jgi:PKD repeat protein
MKRIVFMAFLILLATSFSATALEFADVDGSSSDVPSFIGYTPNRIVVKFDSSTLRGLDKAAMASGRTGLPALDHVGSRHGVMSLRPQFPGAKKKSYKGKVVDLSGWHKVKFSRGVDVLAIVEEYKAIPGVVDAQPVGIYRVNQTPNDPWYHQPGYQWHLPQIWAEEAWDIATGNSTPPIIVAVLDTGVRYFHKDLGGSDASHADPTNVAGNMWINLAEKDGIEGVDDDGVTDSGVGYVDDWIGWDFVDDPCANGVYPICNPCCCYVDGQYIEDCQVPDNDPRDFHGHGTHCAGNVSAINNNEFATASPAGGWGSWWTHPFGNGVKVMALRIGWYGLYVFFPAGMIALDHAAEAFYYAADHGARIASCSWTANENSGGLGEAIDYFLASGGLIFKAAGNDSTETAGDYMCGQRNDVICVAATDQNDCKAYFSTYGPWVDVSAPGVQIGSLYHLYTDEEGDYVAPFDGTSMATPLAASVAALIWSQDTNQSANDVKNILFTSADPIDGLLCNSNFAGKLGAGRINAFEAVLAVGPAPPPFADFSGSPTTGDVPLNVTFADQSTGSVDSWSWDFGDGGSSSAQNPSHTYANPGTYTVSLTATGPGGSDTNTKPGYITAEPPPPPPVADFSGSPPSGLAPLIVTFTDKSTGNITTRNWSFGDGGISLDQNPWHEYLTAGNYTVSLTVSGPDGSDTKTEPSDTKTEPNYISVTEAAPGAAFSGTDSAAAHVRCRGDLHRVTHRDGTGGIRHQNGAELHLGYVPGKSGGGNKHRNGALLRQREKQDFSARDFIFSGRFCCVPRSRPRRGRSVGKCCCCNQHFRSGSKNAHIRTQRQLWDRRSQVEDKTEHPDKPLHCHRNQCNGRRAHMGRQPDKYNFHCSIGRKEIVYVSFLRLRKKDGAIRLRPFFHQPKMV